MVVLLLGEVRRSERRNPILFNRFRSTPRGGADRPKHLSPGTPFAALSGEKSRDPRGSDQFEGCAPRRPIRDARKGLLAIGPRTKYSAVAPEP